MLNKQQLFTILLFITLLAGCQSVPKPQQETTPADVQEVKVDPSAELYDLAISTAKAGQVNESIDFFRQLIAIAPEYPHAHTNLGLLLFQKKDAEQATSEFLSAIEQDNQDAIAYNHLAILERQNGQFKQARDHYQKALEADPDYANAHLNLGILLDIYLQQLEDALAHYRKYQALTETKNEDVEKWIADLERRIQKKAASNG